MDILVIAIIVAIIAIASYKIYIDKKRGKKCMGCPYSEEMAEGNCDCQSTHKVHLE